MSNKKFDYLKKNEGSLASDNHGITEFAKKRKEKIIVEQLQRENIIHLNKLNESSKNFANSTKEYTENSRKLKESLQEQQNVWYFNCFKKNNRENKE